MTDKKKQNLFDFALLKRIIRLADPYRKIFFFSIFLSLTLAVIAPVRPWLIKYAIDNYIIHYHFDSLKFLCLWMFGLLVIESILRYFFNYITSWLGQSIIKDLRIRVFEHIVHQRLKYFDTTPIGTSTTRSINDIEAVNDTFSEGLITIVADLLTILLVICFMASISWKLTIVTISVLPFLLFVTRWFQEGVKKSFQDERTQIARLNAFLQEHITGMRIIQIFAVEEKEKRKFEAINKELRDANIRGIWYYSLFFPAVEICMAVGIGLMVWYASHLILGNEIHDVGAIAAFILYISMLFRPLRFIADKVNIIQRGIVAAERVFKLLDKNEEIPNTGTFIPTDMAGKISFQNVWFSYHNEDWVLKDISFNIAVGETLAIVGATGSGKSSTINVLGRFYDIQRGSIKIDDVEIKDYELSALRSKMSVVLQDVFLFGGSVFDNITLRNEAITREEVIRASQLVGAHEFIMKLPGGYEYLVMERGATLSMGQRQLISFVRALVYNPGILILDEATSSIDTESERLIENAIGTLVQGRTSIVIAHRLSTVRNAHKIMVLDKGELKEFGTHEELLEKNGYYKKLYDMQFTKQKAIV